MEDVRSFPSFIISYILDPNAVMGFEASPSMEISHLNSTMSPTFTEEVHVSATLPEMAMPTCFADVMYGRLESDCFRPS